MSATMINSMMTSIDKQPASSLVVAGVVIFVVAPLVFWNGQKKVLEQQKQAQGQASMKALSTTTATTTKTVTTTTSTSKVPVQSPPQIFSYVPILGPTLELGQLGFGKFVLKYSKIYKNSPIITSTIAGRTMHFVTEPAAFPGIFRYGGNYLSMAPAISDFSQSFFGMSRKGLSTFDGIQGSRKTMTVLLHKHLIKSDGIESLTKSAHRIVKKQIESVINHHDGIAAATMDLYTLIRKVVFRTTLETMVSKSVANDDFIELFETFDGAIPTAFAGLPIRFFAPKSYKAREEMVQIVQRTDFTTSGYLKERQEVLLSMGMSEDDIARDTLLWVWAAGTNFIPSQFWHMYYLASNPDAMEAIRNEIDTILANRRSEVDDDGPFDGTFTTQELEGMVHLESAFKESIRLTTTAIIARTVMQDMVVDLRLSNAPSKFFLEKGSTVVLYPPILHHDPTVFEQPREYHWNRFLTKNGRPKFQSSSGETIVDPFRGFGGGAHYCPGRKFALNVAKGVTANLIHKYDMKVLDTTEVDMTLDGFGILTPQNDVQIQLTLRNQK